MSKSTARVRIDSENGPASGVHRVAPNDDRVARFVRCHHCHLPHESGEARCPIVGEAIEPAERLGEATREARDVFDLLGIVIDDRFRVFDVLGCGGMGAVYEAIDIAEGTFVAVKVMRRSLSGNERAIRRFLRESETTRRLEHPRIVRHMAAGQLPDGSPYLALELLEGRALEHELVHRGPLPVREALALLRQVFEGLEIAHERGVIHRDIKPDNLFIEDVLPGEPLSLRLLDFGIAKLVDPDLATSITHHDEILGTPLYVAPEQILNPETIGAPTDLWAAGVVLYEMLTGVNPFVREHIGALLLEIATRPHLAPSSFRPELDPELDAFVGRLLRKDPADRFRTAGEAIEALDALRRTESSAQE